MMNFPDEVPRTGLEAPRPELDEALGPELDEAPRTETTDRQLDALLKDADQELLEYVQARTDPNAALTAIMADTEPSASDFEDQAQAAAPTARHAAVASIGDRLDRGEDDVVVVLLNKDREHDRSGDSAVEHPTGAAKLVISLRPTQFKGIAEGIILPGSRTRTLTSVLALIVTSVAGITGAVITNYVAAAQSLSWFIVLVLVQVAILSAGIFFTTRHDR